MEEGDAQAKVDVWKYVFGFTPMAVVKCAIQLHIAEALETHGGGPITLTDLSAAVGCSPDYLGRIMRFLIHHGFFKQHTRGDQESSLPSYVQTPLSRMLLRNAPNSLAAMILLESSPVMLAPWHGLSARAKANGSTLPFAAANGEDVWAYAASNPEHSKLINDGMAVHAKVSMSAIIQQYPAAFEGVRSVVDVGGGDGTCLETLVKACPWIHGINFDLPHVISVAPHRDGVEHVSGDMFQSVPPADAAFLMWVLHDWSDEECVQILRNCRDAVAGKEKGKVIIAEAVVTKEGDQDEYKDVRLALDMVMMAHTEKGKERTSEEWENVVKAAGFTTYAEKHIQDVICVIEAFP